MPWPPSVSRLCSRPSPPTGYARLVRSPPSPAPPGSLRPVPALTHAYVIVLENKAYDWIAGSADARFLNDLIARYGLAQAYQAVAHPSQPNYLALDGGTQGVTDNEPHDVAGPRVFDQLESAGRSWRVYAQNAGARLLPRRNGGRRPRWLRNVRPQARTRHRLHYYQRDARSLRQHPGPRVARPRRGGVELIIPSLCHDMHDCDVRVGDAWLRSFVPRILDSAAFRSGGALFITFDEGSESARDSNHVATIVAAPGIAPGTTSGIPHNHYSLLRTIQDACGFGCLAESCTANSLGEFWTDGDLWPTMSQSLRGSTNGLLRTSGRVSIGRSSGSRTTAVARRSTPVIGF